MIVRLVSDCGDIFDWDGVQTIVNGVGKIYVLPYPHKRLHLYSYVDGEYNEDVSTLKELTIDKDDPAIERIEIIGKLDSFGDTPLPFN